MYVMNISTLIGNTPLLKLQTFSTDAYHIYAKLEGQNIGGSIKDRVALAMIEDLEHRGILTKEKILLEPSSGNTGIGLAMIGKAKGYSVKIVMPETATLERVKILKRFGAKIAFCKTADWSGDTAINQVKAMAQHDDRYVMPNQYENPLCVDIHYRTTAAEIINQCPQITHLVATMGTGGTITGVAKRLKKYNPLIHVTGVEIQPNSKIPGPRSLLGYVPPILDFTFIDQRILIEDESAVFSLWNQLAQTEGLLYGPSSAAALSGAMDIIHTQKASSPAHIVVIFPDRGEKYVSIL